MANCKALTRAAVKGLTAESSGRLCTAAEKLVQRKMGWQVVPTVAPSHRLKYSAVTQAGMSDGDDFVGNKLTSSTVTAAKQFISL